MTIGRCMRLSSISSYLPLTMHGLFHQLKPFLVAFFGFFPLPLSSRRIMPPEVSNSLYNINILSSSMQLT